MTTEEKMIKLQHQMKENHQDLEAFINDMNKWEDDIKKKESELIKGKPAEDQKLPPVRNSLQKKKKKKVRTKEPSDKLKSKKISGYDFRAWDKLDVDKMCDEIDKEERKSSSEYETDEEWEIERRKQQALMEKDMGNDYFKQGDFENAVEYYTRGLTNDPSNPILPANRAMALIKQTKYAAAEVDCITALTLDPLYVKAYLRLGASRFGLQKFKESKEAYEKALQLEPQNRTAQIEIDKIDKELSKQKMVTHSTENIGRVKPITKSVQQRSKKPLRRLEIDEVGIEDNTERKTAIAKVQEGQSQAKKILEAQDGEMFKKFTSENQSTSQDSKTSVITEQKKLSDIDTQKLDKRKSQNSVEQNSRKLNLSNGSDKNSKSTHVSVEKSKGATSPREGISSPRKLGIPSTSYQFQADYKVIKHDMQAFYEYFKKLEPDHYPKLFGEALDADILMKILTMFKDFYVPSKEDCYKHLLCLTRVSRFRMTVMFFSRKEKQVLETLMNYLRQSSSATAEEINTLSVKYELS